MAWDGGYWGGALRGVQSEVLLAIWYWGGEELLFGVSCANLQRSIVSIERWNGAAGIPSIHSSFVNNYEMLDFRIEFRPQTSGHWDNLDGKECHLVNKK
jgi:hypothetical protein